MSRSHNSRKGSKNGNIGKEYWKSRLHTQGECPGRFTKKRTSKLERQQSKKEIIAVGDSMKNKYDYSKYKCPYEHLEKECGHHLKGPEGYEDAYGVWCACGFRGPVFYLDPYDLKLEKK